MSKDAALNHDLGDLLFFLSFFFPNSKKIPPFFFLVHRSKPFLSFIFPLVDPIRALYIFVTEQDQACPLITPTANQPVTGLRLTACSLVEGPLLKLETGVREGTQGAVSDCEGGERGCSASR